MRQDQKDRYRLRALIGFRLLDLAAFQSEEEARAGFEAYKRKATEAHLERANPYCLFLVDYEKGETIAEYTELPKGFDGFPLTENKA